MSKITIYNQEGNRVEEQELNSTIFDVKINPEVIHQVIVAQMANARQVLAHTKTRGEIRGGGKKPWKQKGTGRARAGTIRSPLWKGGGIVFGPSKERNFSKKVNKKMKKKALFMVLADKVKSDWMITLDKLELTEGKTKEILKVLENLNKLFQSTEEEKQKKEKILIVIENKNENLIRATKNISRIGTIRADCLNIVDLLKYKYLLITKKGIQKIEKTYLKMQD
ncbi:50S ribosomal protein L4 [Candidatus Kuenenbacteria bacterium HGW-Kuenenbacteria-1]|uniref:Large ribosomal subunit protein uL4 n=1 Tax=Candidatus Kuenenbacteria bacterium HGW-Kuenenbacteria-1 TaxID=2013812 RepID=A0A2N1UNL6_9BACT|nr:MAG: 50S ribosomal protein L4 [Candidatus Kuenenbacteria bacterium HGW-Kuenenbacteria-1]